MPAKKAAIQPEVVETRENRARLHKLVIRNFRCIGSRPVEIELDDIVILVGANNAGKSSILRAYEVIMSAGKAELAIDDFPGRRIDDANLPEIELHTYVTVNAPGGEWIDEAGLVKERWVWDQPGKGDRVGFLHGQNRWANNDDPEKGPWGAVASSRRPQVHSVGAFASPKDSASEIIALLEQIVKDRLAAEQAVARDDQQPNDYQKLLASIGELQRRVATETRDSIAAVESEFSEQIAKVFPGYVVEFDAQPETALEKALTFFKAGSQLLIGPSNGHKSGIERQGGGACRTLLWTALRLLKDRKSRTGSPQVLLLDEPEICLHPNAVRGARDLLYDLPARTGNWQVMVTTHSPCFIDFEKPHTKIARVFRGEDGQVYGTTIFRPQVDQFTDDEKDALKLSNLCDPYLAEFFFGGRTILVEGDTEHAAFNYVISVFPEEFRNLHVVRARGKAAISGLAKILNQFGKPYAVLHDSDRPTCKRRDGTTMANGAWTYNQTIRDAVIAAPNGTTVRLFASVPNFEEAYLGYVSQGEKPFSAVFRLRTDQTSLGRVKDLLQALSSDTTAAPTGALEWNDLGQLAAALPTEPG